MIPFQDLQQRPTMPDRAPAEEHRTALRRGLRKAVPRLGCHPGSRIEGRPVPIHEASKGSRQVSGEVAEPIEGIVAEPGVSPLGSKPAEVVLVGERLAAPSVGDQAERVTEVQFEVLVATNEAAIGERPTGPARGNPQVEYEASGLQDLAEDGRPLGQDSDRRLSSHDADDRISDRAERHVCAPTSASCG